MKARLLAFAAIFALFQMIATGLQSDRGQAGVIVALVIVSATLGAEVWLSRAGIARAAWLIGLGRPRAGGIVAACGVCLILLVAMAVIVTVRGMDVRLAPVPAWHLLGLFAQAGIAEETLFRGYLFGSMRRHSTFWRACFMSMIPFVVVHLWLFISMPWPIALASIGLAAVTSVPFAQLYELGGRTIWPAAILHFIIQSVPKLVTTSDANAVSFALWWMAASAVIPLTLGTLLQRRISVADREL